MSLPLGAKPVEVDSSEERQRSIMRAFGDRLRRLRLATGMSQERLARAAGYRCKSAISKLELASSRMGGITLWRALLIARALGVTLDDLVE